MSTITSSGSASEFDKLIALAQFVQDDKYLDRVQQLRDLEAAAQESARLATEAAADAEAKRAALAQERAQLDRDVATFKTAQHQQQTDMAHRETAIAHDIDSITMREREFERVKALHDDAVATFKRRQTDKTQEFSRREAAISLKERELAADETKLKARIAKIRAATDE